MATATKVIVSVKRLREYILEKANVVFGFAEQKIFFALKYKNRRSIADKKLLQKTNKLFFTANAFSPASRYVYICGFVYAMSEKRKI